MSPLLARGTALIVAAAALLTPQTAFAAPSAAVPVLHWSACGDGLQCADAAVPLDYDQPAGPAITLALIRQPAGDPAHRLGTLFVNNGGPGNSVLDFVAGGDAASVVPADVRAQFDVVGFDPRGVGRSTPVRCFASADEQGAFFADRPAFPVGATETTAFIAGSKDLARRCAERNAGLLAHLSTANVARDLDLLRLAVGDSQLSFAGYSYGALLGLTYAQLFPGKVRALLLDGIPDAREFTRTGPTTLVAPITVRTDSASATSIALDSFLGFCAQAGADGCSFATPDPTLPTVRAKFDALFAKLRKGPLTVPTPDGPVTVTYAFFVDGLRGALQYPPVWGFVADLLQATWTASAAPAAPKALAATADEGYDNSHEAFLSVACGETNNPTVPALWPVIAAVADARTPYFGADWAWAAEPCATWSVKDADRYTGSFTATTAHPPLFVNGRQDAASNYDRARQVAGAVPGARLITVDGPGHPASFIQNTCLAQATAAYLIDLRMPAAGAVCTPDAIPFA